MGVERAQKAPRKPLDSMLFFPNYLSAMKTEVRCWWKLAKSTESISTNGRLSTSGSFQAISKSASSFFPKAFRNQSSGGEQREVNELLLLLLPFRETTSVSWRPSFRLRPRVELFFFSLALRRFSRRCAHMHERVYRFRMIIYLHGCGLQILYV